MSAGTAYSFVCATEECFAIMVVYPHPESPGLLDPFVRSAPIGEPMWDDSSPDCPNCGGSMELVAGDPVHHIIVGARVPGSEP